MQMEHFTDYFKLLSNNILSLSPKDFQIDSYHARIILISHLIWWLIYGFIHFFINIHHKTQKDVIDSKTRIVSIIHALYASLLSFYDFFYFQITECGQNNNDLQNFILCTSLSYFAYDTIICIILGISDNEMLYHHLSVIFGYYSGLSFNHSASEMLRGLLVADISNPIMHLRIIIRNFGLKNTKLYFLCDVIYMIIYILARSIWGFMATYFTMFCKSNLLIVKLSAFFVWSQSLFFMRVMIPNLYYRYKDYLERKKKNVELYWFEHNKKIEELDYYKQSLKKIKEKYIP